MVLLLWYMYKYNYLYVLVPGILLAKPLTTSPDASFGTSQLERFKIEIDSLRNRSNFPLLIHDYVASAL